MLARRCKAFCSQMLRIGRLYRIQFLFTLMVLRGLRVLLALLPQIFRFLRVSRQVLRVLSLQLYVLEATIAKP